MFKKKTQRFNFCLCLTIHVEALNDDLQLDLVGHVAEGAHGHAQLLLGDEAVAVAVEHLERLADLYTNTHTHARTYARINWGYAEMSKPALRAQIETRNLL